MNQENREDSLIYNKAKRAVYKRKGNEHLFVGIVFLLIGITITIFSVDFSAYTGNYIFPFIIIVGLYYILKGIYYYINAITTR